MKKLIAVAASVTWLLSASLYAQSIAPLITNNLAEPYGVAVDANNIYYITDGANNRVVAYDATQGTLTGLAGLQGTAGYSNGIGVFARFWSPQGIVMAGDGTLIVADAGNHVIRRVTTGGNATTIAGGINAGTATSNAGNLDGQGRNAFFNAPAGLAVDNSGSIIYVADVLNNSVRRIDLTTSNVTSLNNAIGQLLRPTAVAVDGVSGNLYVADSGNHCIRVMDTTGNITATYGQPGIPGMVDSLTASDARFNSPRGLLWVDVSTGLLISDAGNHRVRRAYINVPLGGLITVQTYANSDTANLGTPVGLAKDVLGNFPLADLTKNSLLVIQTTPPQPPVGDPKIGVVNIGTNAFGGPDPLLTAVTSATFNNDVLLEILPAETGVNTFYNYTTATTLDPNNLTRTAPFYQDHLTVPSSSILTLSGQPTTPYLVKARSTQAGRRPSNVVTAQFIFRVSNPVINGDNFNSFIISDSTTNAELYYTYDGVTQPTRGLPAIRANSGDKLSLPNPGSNIVFKIQAFKEGYSPSDPVTKVFNLADFRTTTIGITNYSGATNFVGGPGDTIVVPVQVFPIAGDVLQSLQFRFEVTPFDSTTPSVATNQIKNITLSTNDFIVLPLPSTNAPGVIIYTNFTAVAVSGLFTNNTPTNTGLAISYIGNNNGMKIQDQAIAAAVAVTIPPTAANGQQYAMAVLFPSATSDGRSTNVVVKPITNNYVVITVSTALNYVVGNTASARWYNIGDFGNTNLSNADVNNAFFASLGLFLPYTGTDALDAMDAFPTDIDTGGGVVGGDGQIRFLDWQIILKRSLRLPGFTTNYKRGWNSTGRRYVIVPGFNFNPDVPAQVISKMRSSSDGTWLRQASISAQQVEKVAPGQRVEVPIYLKVKAGYQVAGLQLRAVITPEGNAPPIIQAATFIPQAGLVTPMSYTSNNLLPVNQAIVAWSLTKPFNPALQGNQQLGIVRFTVPDSARAGQDYVVRFLNADGAPNDSTQYDFETIPARIWIGTAALLPQELISDEWKIQYFGSVDNPLAADNANPNGDGISNLVAYQTGHDPSTPRLYVLTTDWRNNLEQNGFKLRWYAAPGQRYIVEKSDNLTMAQWRAVIDQQGQGQISETVDYNVPGKAQFYRIRRLPVP